MEIIISDTVKEQLRDLVDVLYLGGKYKSYQEQAELYVAKIEERMYDIPHRPHYKCLTKKLGNYFIRHTVKSGYIYYIVFDKKGDRYYIENIIGSSDSRRHRHIAGTK